MFVLLLELFENWIGIFYLSARQHWDIFQIALNFTAAVMEYFTCSLISIRVRDDGAIDMPAFYQKQRPILFTVYLALDMIGLFKNWWDRNTPREIPNQWLWADLTIVPMLVLAVIAGWARPLWLQWFAGLGMLALDTYFLIMYAI